MGDEITRNDEPHFTFQCVDNVDALSDAYRLRFDVYCTERAFLSRQDYPTGREIDDFDPHSLHFSAFNRVGDTVGTIRLVQPSALGFPLLQHCQLHDEVIPKEIVEISRLAVSKNYRRRVEDDIYGITPEQIMLPDPRPEERRRRPEIVLGLYKIIYQESKRRGITHWLAAMERSLVRLLWRYGFSFEAIGPEVDYYGPVTPYITNISEIERDVLAIRPSIFKEFNEGL
jgi:N-acyl amino acid synthase of PEP-CTERM/exosortase system